MSLQICHCGWSKVTTYQGLRTHQGKMGCTPKGMGIPESEQYRFNTYRPSFSFVGPTIKLTDPFENIFTSSINSDTDSSSDKSLQVNQGMLGYTPKEMRIPESEQFTWTGNWKESLQNNSSPLHATLVKTENVPFIPEANPAIMDMIKKLVENQQQAVQMGANLDNRHQTLDFNTGSQSLFTPLSQTFTSPKFSAAPEETNKSLFETPQRSHQTVTSLDKPRRALDFSTGEQQMQKMVFGIPTTTAQETTVPPKDKEREKEREKKEEAQKLLKARQERMKAELQQKIQIREHKVDEVISSLKACKGSLDAEWLEINSVFSEVISVVEDARQKALQPLEERRQKVKQKAQDLIQKLEKEIDQIKKTIKELDKNPDLQVCPPTGLNESKDWKKVKINTSLSFGTLRTQTSAMVEQIKNKLENLSSIELKRITMFAVDVRLDTVTAHQCLDVSDDGKKVRDGEKNQRLPDAPGRFDRFGSILALNCLTSGKAYWEVQVSNKTGWDLGVARGSANRKGTLSLNPDNGYWVTVHYEGKKYAALTAPPVSLSLKQKPQKVGVFVDYEEGLVSFYDVTSQSHIYSFTECSFNGEIFPYFSPHLKQNGKNSDPLIISTVKHQ